MGSVSSVRGGGRRQSSLEATRDAVVGALAGWGGQEGSRVEDAQALAPCAAPDDARAATAARTAAFPHRRALEVMALIRRPRPSPYPTLALCPTRGDPGEMGTSRWGFPPRFFLSLPRSYRASEMRRRAFPVLQPDAWAGSLGGLGLGSRSRGAAGTSGSSPQEVEGPGPVEGSLRAASPPLSTPGPDAGNAGPARAPRSPRRL